MPYIDVDESKYYYLEYERGVTNINRQTSNLDELLYWIFREITFTMASNSGAQDVPASAIKDNKIRNMSIIRDNRRFIHAHQLELLGKLSSPWRLRKEFEIDDPLKKHPYR